MGLKRLHWVTEWQERRVPHLHMACWFDRTVDQELLKKHWCEVYEHQRPAYSRQHITPIHAFGGWAQYVSKHASRGAGHYQRNNWARPRGWQSSGRVWGKWGDWTLIEPVKVQMTSKPFYAYRRLVRNWRKSRANTGQARHMANIMLQNPKDYRRDQWGDPMPLRTCEELRKLNALRGTSEWIPERMHIDILIHLMDVYGDDVQVEPSSIDAILQRMKFHTTPA